MQMGIVSWCHERGSVFDGGRSLFVLDRREPLAVGKSSIHIALTSMLCMEELTTFVERIAYRFNSLQLYIAAVTVTGYIRQDTQVLYVHQSTTLLLSAQLG